MLVRKSYAVAEYQLPKFRRNLNAVCNIAPHNAPQIEIQPRCSAELRFNAIVLKQAQQHFGSVFAFMNGIIIINNDAEPEGGCIY